MLKNREFELQVSDPIIDKIQEKPNNDFAIVCTALVKDVSRPFADFKQQIINEIQKLPADCLLWMLPEYCFRDTAPAEVMDFIHNELMSFIPKPLTVILGTIEFTLNEKYTNNAIIIHDQQIWFRPKTKILKGEEKNGLVKGDNAGIIQLPFFNLGVLVCADLWDNSLVKKLVKQKVDILAVPAWTATTDGETALNDWSSLARTESTGKSIIVAVCDHFQAPPNSHHEVAGATQIRSPDGRAYRASPTPVYQSVAFVNFNRIQQARTAWADKGLAQTYFFKQLAQENQAEKEDKTYSNAILPRCSS